MGKARDSASKGEILKHVANHMVVPDSSVVKLCSRVTYNEHITEEQYHYHLEKNFNICTEAIKESVGSCSVLSRPSTASGSLLEDPPASLSGVFTPVLSSSATPGTHWQVEFLKLPGVDERLVTLHCVAMATELYSSTTVRCTLDLIEKRNRKSSKFVELHLELAGVGRPGQEVACCVMPMKLAHSHKREYSKRDCPTFRIRILWSPLYEDKTRGSDSKIIADDSKLVQKLTKAGLQVECLQIEWLLCDWSVATQPILFSEVFGRNGIVWRIFLMTNVQSDPPIICAGVWLQNVPERLQDTPLYANIVLAVEDGAGDNVHSTMYRTSPETIPQTRAASNSSDNHTNSIKHESRGQRWTEGERKGWDLGLKDDYLEFMNLKLCATIWYLIER